MSDIDGNFPTDPADQPYALMSDAVFRALVQLEREVRTEFDREKQRADAAESSLAETRRDLAAAEAELAAAASRSRAIDELMFKSLGEYLEDNMRAQRGLIAITRQLLESAGLEQATPEATLDDASAPVAEPRYASLSVVASELTEPDSSAESEERSGALIPSVPDAYQWDPDVEPITDEHRIIDQSNRADMERLNSTSRLFNASTGFKRKNLLTGA